MADRLNRINKLLRLYENNPEKAESEAALRKAAQEMRLYIDGQARIQPSLASNDAPERIICSGCGLIKPSHKRRCPTAKLERQMGWGALVSCFSCSTIMAVWALSAVIGLFQSMFG
jgi:hypothetical protein